MELITVQPSPGVPPLWKRQRGSEMIRCGPTGIATDFPSSQVRDDVLRDFPINL